MRAKTLPVLTVIFALLAIAAAAMALLQYRKPSYVPSLEIVGDVEYLLTVRKASELGALKKVEFEEKSYDAVLMSDVVEAAGALEVGRLILIADDGFSAEIGGDALAYCYLAFDSEDGWRNVAPEHPISANGTHIVRIVIVSHAENTKILSVNCAGKEKRYSVGELYAGTTISLRYPEGISEKSVGGLTLTSGISTRRECIFPESLGVDASAGMSITDENGQVHDVSAGESGYFQLCGNTVRYINPETRLVIENIRRISLI